MTTTTRPAVLSANTIIGEAVRNYQGEDLGSIKDLMIDLEDGCIAYAVVSFGGFMGFGDKLFAIPWPALRVDPVNQTFLLDADRKRLETAPGFDKNDWPDIADRTWGTRVHGFYGVPPYWDD